VQAFYFRPMENRLDMQPRLMGSFHARLLN